jgi:tryptophan synthase beta chain
MNEAFREWSAESETTHYIVGSAAGPHPYPLIVRDFQSTIGREARVQMIDETGRLPDLIVAALGGGSNSIGMFHPFLADDEVELIAVEAAGSGLESGSHAAALHGGREGVLHGARTMFLQDEDGQVQEAASISAGLDYPGVGPEITALMSFGRLRVAAATDAEAVEAFDTCTKLEGIVPALETAHAVAHAVKEASRRSTASTILVSFSGRGDKDLDLVASWRAQHARPV